MSLTAADLDIANAACAQIGETPLQAMDEETDAGQAASLLYLEVVEFNIGLYNFSFSKQLYQLSQVANATSRAGFDYVFDMPAERLGDPLYVTDDATDPDRRFSKYAIINSQIHASKTPLYAMCRFRPNPDRWTPTFRGATITALAARFAMSLGHDRATADAKHVEAYGTPSEQFRGGMLGAAIRADAYSVPPRNQQRDSNPLTRAWRS